MNVPARAPLAPEIVETIERFEKLMGETELDVQKMRQVYRSVMSEQGQAKDPVKTRDLLVPTRHGSVSARLYTP
ncbi:MAG TPA: hypothetical protein VJQ54_17560, partial [Candidatus Sulfotelmatobacter sp.]|nr:hypothetical protein [Candidatus Sulfotelmatobacter sp.]